MDYRTFVGCVESQFWVQFAQTFERVENKGRRIAAEDVFRWRTKGVKDDEIKGKERKITLDGHGRSIKSVLSPPLEDSPTGGHSTGLFQRAVSRRVICNFPPSPSPPDVFATPAHDYERHR